MCVCVCACRPRLSCGFHTMSLDVIGLVSGGKDSIYCMMECVRLGHRIVGLGNMRPPARAPPPPPPPPPAGGDVAAIPTAAPAPAAARAAEIDSFMFQSVGHAAVDGVAEAMGLPLVRGDIVGGAVHAGLEYEVRPGDEVEDMLALLRAAQVRALVRMYANDATAVAVV